MKTLKSFFITFVLLFQYSVINAQVQQQWAERYTGLFQTSVDYGKSIAIDNAGNTYVTGQSDNIGGGTSIATVKYNASGTQVWAKRYPIVPDNGQDAGYSIAVVSLSGLNYIYVTGKIWNSSQGYDYVTLKYDDDPQNPNPIWIPAPVYNGPGNADDYANRIEVDASGNAYVTGGSAGSGTGPDYATIKYDINGVQQWVARYDGPLHSDDVAASLKVDRAGSVYVTGRSAGIGTLYDFATIAYSSSGSQLWEQRYNGPSNLWDWGDDIAVDTYHGVYITGVSEGNPISGTSLFTTIRYYIDGTFAWAKNDFFGEGLSVGIFKRPCQGQTPCYVIDVFVTGQKRPSNQGLTIKYDDDGNQVQVATYPTNGSSFETLALDQLENVYVAGFNNKPTLTVKYNTDLSQIWEASYNNGGSNELKGIKVDADGNTYVTGITNEGATGSDYLTIKYTSPPCCGPNAIHNSNENENKVNQGPKEFSLEQNYPNPFNPSTKIKYAIPNDANVVLKVYDILGEEVATIVNEAEKAGLYALNFDGSNLAGGIYFYKIETGNFTDTKKMLLLK